MQPTTLSVEDHVTTPPAPRHRWGWRVGCAVGVVAALAAWRLPGRFAAAEVVSARSSPWTAADNDAGDFQLMVFARQALQQDDQLGSLNLGVTVRGRVATLWGGIPSEALARRAEERLHAMTGIAAIHNELRVEPRGQPKKNLFALPVSPSGSDQTQIAGSFPAPGSLTAFPGSRLPEFRSSFAPEASAARSPEPVTVMPPLVITYRPPPFPEPLIVENRSTAPAAVEDLAATLDRLRVSESRFRQIRVDVQGGVVYLSGAAPRPGDLMAFAQSIARVPGVEHVILGQTRAPRKESLQLP